MLSFFGAVWAGTVRTVLCPRCRGSQTVVRRPMPFEVTCRDCRRSFHVTERRVVAVRVGRSRPSPINPSDLVAH